MLKQEEREKMVEEIAEKLAELMDAPSVLRDAVNPTESVILCMARAAFFVAEAFSLG